MSKQDREKWQARYSEGAYTSRPHPSAWLTLCLPKIVNPPSLKALDLACGAGRNALYLASRGYQVAAMDIAAEALRRGRESAGPKDTICWIEHDLDEGLATSLDGFGLIIMIRYLDLALLRTAVTRLLPGGYLLAEVHLQTDENVAGPSGSAFRAGQGELAAAADGLQIIDCTEGLVEDPDGSTVALARLLARKKAAPV